MLSTRNCMFLELRSQRVREEIGNHRASTQSKCHGYVMKLWTGFVETWDTRRQCGKRSCSPQWKWKEKEKKNDC